MQKISSAIHSSPDTTRRFRSTQSKELSLPRQYCVYILTNKSHNVLYTGVTNDLKRRVIEHRSGKGSDFTTKYRINILVWYEMGEDIHAAIAREKQIKGGSRQDKIRLIEEFNPAWRDLFEEI